MVDTTTAMEAVIRTRRNVETMQGDRKCIKIMEKWRVTMQNTMERQWMNGAKVHNINIEIWHITGTYEWWRRNTAHTWKLWWHDRRRWDPIRKSQSQSGAGRPGWHISEVPIAIEGRTAIDLGPFDLKTRSTAKLASEGNETVGHEHDELRLKYMQLQRATTLG